MNWYRWEQDDLILHLRIQPKAAKDRFVGPYGDHEYKIALTAPPVEGRANAGLLKFLADAFGLPRSRIHILSGETSRSKRLRLKSPKRLPIPVEK